MQFEPIFVMRIFSHHFQITRQTPRVQALLKLFSNRYFSRAFIKERGKWITKPDKFFGLRLPFTNEYRFHINLLEEFKDYLRVNYITEDLYSVEYMPIPAPHLTSLPVKKGWVPKDYQEPIIDFILEEARFKNRVIHDKLVGIQTGKGKTATAMFAMARLGYRSIIIIKPKYIEKWFSDVSGFFDIKKTDIMVVQGGDHFRGLIELAKQNRLDAKIIILSNRTYHNYLKSFEQDPHSNEYLSYECHPDDLFETLKVSFKLIDEVHEEFHGNFKTKMYTHLPASLSLSATLINNNPFLEKMYAVAYPKEARYDSLALDCYANVRAISYNFKEPERIRLTEFGSPNYSHVAFEKSIMYRPYVKKPYFGMIKYFIDLGYIEKYIPGDKCLIFAATINMCTELVQYLRAMYPNKDVRRYVEDDPYENIMEADITVSTILSSGTALDIPNLRVVLNTISIDSAQANVQTLGRLRKLPDRDVWFYYFYCEQFDKHKQYHDRRKALLRDRVATIKDMVYPYHI